VIVLASTSGALSDAVHAFGQGAGRVRRALLSRSQWFVAQTEEGARELKAFVPPDRTVVVPNPVLPAPSTALDGRRCAAFSGRFSEEKDLFRLLEAWRSIAAKDHQARLLLAGAGGAYRSVERELRQAVASEDVLRRSVEFTGWVQDIGKVLKRANVYVFPSRSEGMSNSLLEACSWRRIVVASDIPANRAVLSDDYPLLFAAGNTEELLAALERAFDDPAVRAESLRRINSRLSEFSLNTVIGRLEDLIYAADRPRN
jgi:glycosyltransferase involved in cell wall biosynthesis